ncbi:hypothetical protein RE92_08480 [Paenibacillus polymyxa]|nr:hypothetical protein RE92_08480 [Paenibacillus polymyxa]
MFSLGQGETFEQGKYGSPADEVKGAFNFRQLIFRQALSAVTRHSKQAAAMMLILFRVRKLTMVFILQKNNPRSPQGRLYEKYISAFCKMLV